MTIKKKNIHICDDISNALITVVVVKAVVVVDAIVEDILMEYVITVANWSIMHIIVCR